MRNFSLAFVVGNGEGGAGSPSLLFLRRMMVFLYVSFAKKVMIADRIAKNITVHWVQRQDLRTVTKLPRTGLRVQLALHL